MGSCCVGARIQRHLCLEIDVAQNHWFVLTHELLVDRRVDLVIFWKRGAVGGLQKREQRGSRALASTIEIYKTPPTRTQKLGQPERMDAPDAWEHSLGAR